MKKIEVLHRVACDEGIDTYIDPVTGYHVLTSQALLKQGKCCGNSCRHCPYGHVNVDDPLRVKLQMLKPVLMNWENRSAGLDILFWSGGKDSFLTFKKLLDEKRNIVLLTSFGSLTNSVSIQNIHIKNIVKQAEFFKVPLCLVPLFPNTDYKESINAALNIIVQQTGNPIERLVFGDLHLKDLRQWRVSTWSEYEVYTPLFNEPYSELLEKLWKLQKEMDLEITLSTKIVLSDQSFEIGTPYTPELVEALKHHGADAMLENGEGHTLVFPKGQLQQ